MIVSYLFYISVIVLGIVVIISYQFNNIHNAIFLPILIFAVIMFVLHFLKRKRK